MREMTSSTWLRRGSCVIYEKQLLAPLIQSGCMVSLRHALGWMLAWPQQPPAEGQTVLVGGLQTCLEVLPPTEAEDFLQKRVKPFIEEFQSYWPQCGLVFGFGAHPNAFRITAMKEEIEFVRADKSAVRLSAPLWNGSGTLDMYQIFHLDPQSKHQSPAGFYVPRS